MTNPCPKCERERTEVLNPIDQVIGYVCLSCPGKPKETVCEHQWFEVANLERPIEGGYEVGLLVICPSCDLEKELWHEKSTCGEGKKETQEEIDRRFIERMEGESLKIRAKFGCL